jgi:hypothetical protein
MYNRVMIGRLWQYYNRVDVWQLMAWYLTVLILVGIYSFGIVEGLLRFAVVMGLGAGDYFLHRLHTPGYNKWPLSGTITARIVWLVLPFDVPILLLVAAIAVALLSKHLLRWGKRHIFNPAAVGLTVIGLLFGTPFGWWGDTVVWLTILLGLFVVVRVKRQLQVLAFVAAYLTTLLVVSPGTLGTTLWLFVPWFFTLAMVPEPMTSSTLLRGQIGFGATAGVLAVALGFVAPLAPVALPGSLLAANLIAAYFRTRPIPGLSAP